MTDQGPVEYEPVFGMFTVDAGLVVRTWDPWIATITGIAPEKALNRPLAALVPELETRGLFEVLRGVLDRGTIEVLSPALHQHWIDCPPRKPSIRFDRMQQRVQVGPLREDGRITGVAVTVEDVTARMEDERVLADSVDALTGGLGDRRWTARQQQVRALAPQGRAIIDALVATLRTQHHNFNVLSSLLDLIALGDLDVVEPMIACLESDDADLRMQAALILGERGDQRAVPALTLALDDSNVNVRFHAIEALGRLRAMTAVEPIVKIAEQRDFFLAFPAVQALALLGDTSVAGRLVPLLADQLLSAAVADALGVLGDDVVAEPLVRLLGEPHAPVDAIAETLAALHERYERRYGAGDQIATIVRRAITASATQNLLDAVHRVSSDRLRGIAQVLGWLEGQAVQRALARLLGQSTIRAQVVEALVRYGSGVVDLLVEQLLAEDFDTRQAAAVALGRIGDRRATPALVAALKDPDLAVPAAGSLARIGDARAFDALLALVGHDDSAIRQATIAALNSIGHAEMPQRVLKMLDDASPLVRESATKIAGYFGYQQCLRRVIDRCSDPSEAVRRAAIEQLPMFDDRRCRDRLVEALATDTPSVRAAAAAAFTHVDAVDAIDPLMRALDDRDPWVRYFALRSLGSFQHASAALAVRDRLEHDPAGQVRLAAIDVLGRLQPADILSVLEPLVRSDDADTARAAIRALQHVQDPAAEVALDDLSRANDVWRRLEAVAALGDRGGSHAISVLEWVAAADEARDVAEAAIGGLARLASRDDEHGAAATRSLVALTAEPSRREPAVAALARLPVGRATDVASGLAHASPSVRKATVDALSRMRHTDATRWIETALEDASPAVRSAAAGELRRLGSRNATRKLVMLARTDPDLEVRQAAMMASGRTASE